MVSKKSNGASLVTTNSIRVTRTTKVAGKGQVYFINKFAEDECLAEERKENGTDVEIQRFESRGD